MRKPVNMLMILLLVGSGVVFALAASSLIRGTGLSSSSIANPSAPVIFNVYGSQFSYKWRYLSTSPADPGAQGTTSLGYVLCGSYGSPYCSVPQNSPSGLTSSIGIADVSIALAWQGGGTVFGDKYVTGWTVKMPGDLVDPGCSGLQTPGYKPSSIPAGSSTMTGCTPTGSYGVTGSLGGLSLLKSGTSQWQYDGASCPADPCVQTVQRQVAANGQTLTQTFYVTRFYTNLYLSVTPNISVTCGGSTTQPPSYYYPEIDSTYKWTCPTESQASQLCLAFFGCYGVSLDTALKTDLGNVLSVVNPLSTLSNSQIALQIAVPPSALTSPQTWFGVYQVSIGGQGEIGTGGCAANNAYCTTGVGAHTALGVYSDILLRNGVAGALSQYTGLSGYTVEQLAGIVPSTANATVQTAIPLKSFGVQYSISNTCGIATLQSCFSSTGSQQLNIPLLIDVVGSAPLTCAQNLVCGPDSQTGQTILKGKLLDGGSFFCSIGFCGPLQGGQVTDGPICNTPGCVQLGGTTGTDGTFSIIGVSPGGHVFWFYKNGYAPASQTVNIVQGQANNLQSLVLNPTIAAGTVCLVPPLNNPLPGQPPIFGGICFPVWEVVLVFLITGALLAFTIFLVVPSRRKFGVTAGRFGGSF